MATPMITRRGGYPVRYAKPVALAFLTRSITPFTQHRTAPFVPSRALPDLEYLGEVHPRFIRLTRGHGRAVEDQGHRSFASARRPAPVIRTRVTSTRRPPATMRSMLAVASPALTSSTRSSVLKP